MKICILTDTIFNLGGVQRVVSVLANELSKFHDVTILCTSDKYPINRNIYNLDKRIKVNIESNINKNNRRFFKKLFYYIIKKLSKVKNITIKQDILLEAIYPKEIRDNFINYLKPKEYDVIIGVEGHNSLILSLISESLSSKMIGWQHNSYEAYFNNYYYEQVGLFSTYLPNLDYCVVLTNKDREQYLKNMNNKIKCITIYNPLSFKSDKKIDNEGENILFVGRLVETQKGLDILIDIFKTVNELRPNWRLMIVGEGKDKEKLLKRIKENNLVESVNLFNHDDNIKEHYLNSNIFLSTSRWEGFGLVITEAMECGVPVISFANSGPSEIINKNMINGILIDKYDIDRMVESIVYLIDNKEVRKNMSIEAQKRAKDFSIDKIITEWLQIIE